MATAALPTPLPVPAPAPAGVPAVGGPSGNSILAEQAKLNQEALVLNLAMARLQMILGLIGKLAGR
jgi:hypothetical protein